MDSMCRPPGSWGWGDLPNPVAYAHRQRCAALRAKSKQPNSQMISEKSSTIEAAVRAVDSWGNWYTNAPDCFLHAYSLQPTEPILLVGFQAVAAGLLSQGGSVETQRACRRGAIP